MKVLDHGYVELVEDGCWGSDEAIIRAARMSTNKGFQGWGYKCEHCGGNGNIVLERSDAQRIWMEHIPCSECDGKPYVAGDEKLLRYLYEHKHMTPFEMAGLTVEVQAPIMVFREWHRHRTQSFNEMSGRYTELPDLYYIPSIERLMAGKQSQVNKQGSDDGFTESQANDIQFDIMSTTEYSRRAYEWMLSRGVSRELARLVLPVNQYSRMRASANLRNWLAFLALRLDGAAQFEIREYAKVLAALIEQQFPRTYALFNEGRNG